MFCTIHNKPKKLLFTSSYCEDCEAEGQRLGSKRLKWLPSAFKGIDCEILGDHRILYYLDKQSLHKNDLRRAHDESEVIMYQKSPHHHWVYVKHPRKDIRSTNVTGPELQKFAKSRGKHCGDNLVLPGWSGGQFMFLALTH